MVSAQNNEFMLVILKKSILNILDNSWNNSCDSFSDADDSSIVSGLTNLYLNKHSNQNPKENIQNLSQSTGNGSSYFNEYSFYQSTKSSSLRNNSSNLNKSEMQQPNNSQVWLKQRNLNKSIF